MNIGVPPGYRHQIAMFRIENLNAALLIKRENEGVRFLVCLLLNL
ncbi:MULTISPECIES: hypothetical protein [Methanocalculus]|nr:MULTISPECIES: hypothetical protein [unclassified Methanocalculus]MCP1661419.1 hypothetical protein [Methanocalculus sp. AMF5]